MGRRKGSLNKKTLLKMQMEAQANADQTSNSEQELFKNTDTEHISEQEMVQSATVSTNPDTSQVSNTEQASNVEQSQPSNTSYTSDTQSAESSLLEDFLNSQETEVEPPEQEIENEQDSNVNSFVSLDKQLQTLDFLIVTLLEKLFKKKIERMTDEDAQFLVQLAGNDDVNLLPSGKYMFYAGLFIYYFSKL